MVVSFICRRSGKQAGCLTPRAATVLKIKENKTTVNENISINHKSLI